MTKKERMIPKCFKCGRPLHPIMIKLGQAFTVSVKDDEGNEITQMICPLCSDEK